MNEASSTIRCPHCGARIERPSLPEGEMLAGSPLRNCPECDRLYFDPAYMEPALDAYDKAEIKFPYIKILYALIPTAGTLVYLRTWLDGTNSIAHILTLVFGAIAVFFDVMLVVELIRAAKKSRVKNALLERFEGRGEPMDEAMRASLERLSKKDYLSALNKCGEDVPKYFFLRIGEKPERRRLLRR